MLKLVFLLASVAMIACELPYDRKLMQNPNLFEGDIAGDIKLEPSSDNKALLQVPTSSYGRWVNGIVYYTISNQYTAAQLSTIQAGMRAIEDQTRQNGRNCITFVQRTNQANWVAISKTGGGCYSYVGRQLAAGSQQVSLDDGCVYTMIVAHELLHALGVWHEQSRPDRDTFVIINLAVVNSQYHHNFNRYTTGVDLAGTSYDILSIMHYENNAFSTNGQNSVTARDGTVLVNASRKSRLTDADAIGLVRFYSCS